MRNSQTKSLGEGKNSVKLPDEDTGGDEPAHFLFYQDEVGLRATDELNDPLDTVYYLGIIDILTPWSAVKQLEGIWKGLNPTANSTPSRYYVSVHICAYTYQLMSF